MFVISAIRPVSRRAGRFDIVVDEETVATLSLDAIERLGLAIGTDISGLRDRLDQETAQMQVSDRALNMLAFRARSSAELARALVRKGEDKALVGVVITRLVEQGLLDDAAFAESFTRAKVAGAGHSRRRVQQELARKGIAREVSDLAIETVFRDERIDTVALVDEAARRKLRGLSGLEPAVQRRRLYAFLARRGFRSDEIAGAMSRAHLEERVSE